MTIIHLKTANYKPIGVKLHKRTRSRQCVSIIIITQFKISEESVSGAHVGT